MPPKTWPTKPSNEDVLAHVQAFFAALTAGKVEEAEAMVSHAWEDWNENVYNLFQDHYLIHETPPDSSFEGNWWKQNRAWLADLSHQGGEWMGKHENVLWVDVVYRGAPSGYVGEFQVEEADGGGFVVQHVAFKMA